MLPHFAGNVRHNDMIVFELNSKGRIGERFGNHSIHLYGFFLCQNLFQEMGAGELCKKFSELANLTCWATRCNTHYHSAVVESGGFFHSATAGSESIYRLRYSTKDFLGTGRMPRVRRWSDVT